MPGRAHAGAEFAEWWRVPAIHFAWGAIILIVSFGASSLDFFIYTFTKTTVWTEFHEIKEQILFEIAAIVASRGAEIAFPTQTLHVDRLAEMANAQLRSQSS